MTNIETIDKPLAGRIALVAGATRGAGRGVAQALGDAGATVWCTGRSTRQHRSEYDRAETIEDTADLINNAGGTAVARQVDHTDEAQVRDLVAQIEREHGRLDIAVTSLGGENEQGLWDKPIWEQDSAVGRGMLRGILESHLLTATHALGLLHRTTGGLHITLTDGDAAYNDTHYRINAYFDTIKTALTRLAFSFGHELAQHGGTAVALSPGWLRSEMMLDIFGVQEDNWRDAWTQTPTGETAPEDFAISESPLFLGRCVVALAADPERSRWNQRSSTSEVLAAEYGVNDLDGSRPRAWSFITALEKEPKPDVVDYR
ncbi:SDR family oxidoreductase [Cumulibacter soli]|uniref:SDR family oxidoreductase n=1 Tax=Cumulibacter soli TaxID=2546344 RepID=UPI0010678803|nr:SDR family oxidoreductase [Cumulibacter soli]